MKPGPGWISSVVATLLATACNQNNGKAVVALEVSGISGPLVAGAPADFTLIARAADGSVADGYRGTVSFSADDPGAVVPAPYTFTAADAGRHTFSQMLVLKKAGTRTLSTSDAASASHSGSAAVVVVPAAASEVRLSGLGPQVVANVPSTVSVALFDEFGNAASNYRGTIDFASSDARAVLPAAYAFTDSDAGAHSFADGVRLRTAGVQTVMVTAPNSAIRPGKRTVGVLSRATQAAPVTGSETVLVLPAAASTLAVSGLSASVVAGTASSATITATDAYGNVATGYRGTVHFTCTDGAATLPPNHAFTAGDAGVFNVASQIILRTAGSQMLTVTDTADGTIVGQAQITVSPGSATSLAVSAPASATAGNAVTVSVTARDAQNNVVTSYSGLVTLTSNDPAAVLPPAYSFTPGDAGTHGFPVTFKTAGSRTVTATDALNVTGSAGVSVSAGAVSALAVSGFPASITAGVQGSITVRAVDGFGNTVSGYAGAVHFTSSDANATLPANSTLTSGTGTFQATLKTAGTQSLTATDMASSGINGQQGGIAVSAAGVASLSLTGYPSPATAGTAATLHVTARDAFGNVATSYAGPVVFTSSDPQAVLPGSSPLSQGTGDFQATLRTAGTRSITLTDPSNSSRTASQTGIAVNNAAASVLAVGSFPLAVTAGIAAPVSVVARDAYGNLDASFAGVVHLSSTDPQAVLGLDSTLVAGSGTFSAELRTAGIQSITASSGLLTGTEGGIAVSPAAAVTLDVTGLPGTVTAGQTVSFTCTAHDAYANVATNYLGTAHFSSTDSQAVLPPDHTFTSQDQGVFNGSVTFKTSGSQTLIATEVSAPPSIDLANSVLQYHRSRTHDGHFVQPALTHGALATMHRDASFAPATAGNTYAQPLYVAQIGGPDLLITATEQNEVTVWDGNTGALIWQTTSATLGSPVPLNKLLCGNINPLGITGTPVIDAASRTLFFDAMTTNDGGTTKRHKIYALSLDDGSVRPGWPVDVNATASFGGTTFDSAVQNQRGALSLVNGVVYVPYGGHAGDCGVYHGWLVGVNVATRAVTSWATGAVGGAIWAPSGTSSDGTSIFAATGNTFSTATWNGGESVLRFGAGPVQSGGDADRFTPTDWLSLDDTDTDIGSSGPLLVDLPGQPLVVQMGKNGTVYLIDRNNMGGLGGDLFHSQISTGLLMNGPATLGDAAGVTVYLEVTGGNAPACPANPSGPVMALRILPGPPARFTFAWCGFNSGRSSPFVTTSDGLNDPTVWTIGAEGDGRLRGFDADSGGLLYTGAASGDPIPATVQHFSTAIAARGRIIVAGNGHVYRFHP